MKIKADWEDHLHRFRAREFDLVFGLCPDRAFDRVLEIGAGDGFQSRLLLRIARHVVSTDWYPPPSPDDPRITALACPAEDIASRFGTAEFDLVYSSNVFEHLAQPQVVLQAIQRVLRPNGVAVHVMPSPLWKFANMALHTPNIMAQRFERYTAPRVAAAGPAALRVNNPVTGEIRKPKWQRLFLPDPHGVSTTNLAEFAAFSRARWRREFAAAGFKVVGIRKGPLSSGYGFGLDRMRDFLSARGLVSEWIYVTTRATEDAPAARHLL